MTDWVFNYIPKQTHLIPQTPGWSASRPLWYEADCFPEPAGLCEDSYTGGTLGCTGTSSHWPGTQTGPQSYSQCDWGQPGQSGSASRLARWPGVLRKMRDEEDWLLRYTFSFLSSLLLLLLLSKNFLFFFFYRAHEMSTTNFSTLSHLFATYLLSLWMPIPKTLTIWTLIILYPTCVKKY